MADPILPRDLAAAPSVPSSASIIVDNGVNVQKATPGQIADTARPFSSQAEAEAGSDNTKTMTPLRVKQAIDARGYGESIASKEPAISLGTTSQFLRGDKTWQALDKSAVGLGSVDDTSDADKPISTLQQVALDGKASAAALGSSSDDMGTTGGPILTDNADAKTWFEELQAAILDVPGSGGVKANASALGVTATANDMGSFAGGTIPDNLSAKEALQALETAVEGKVDGAGAIAAAVGSSPSQAPSRTALAAADGVFLVGNAVQYRASRAALASQTNTSLPAFLTEVGRMGEFVWSSANLSAAVTSDPAQGLYVPPASDPTGASGAWVRVWNGIDALAEWFGAIAGGADCSVAIMRGLAICPVVRLGPNDYWITSTVKVTKANRRLIGSGSHYQTNAGEATRILTSSATIDMVQVGPDTFTTVNDIPRGMIVQDFYCGRTTGPDKTVKPTGVLFKYTLGSEAIRVKSVDSTYSFRYYGSVACYARWCNANRVVAGTGTGTDEWTGYLVDGTASIGLAGGNGSVYIDYCQAGCNLAALQTGTSYGYRLVGGFQDTFLTKPESVSCNVGISIEGGTPGNANVEISHPIMDACFKWGIYINGLLAGGSVQITDPYVGHNSSTQFGVYINGSVGTVNIDGGQLLGGSFTGQGVAIIGSKGVSIDGFLLKDVAGTGLGTGGTCSNLKLRTIHHNPAATGGAAVQLNGTAANACVVEPLVYGKASAFTFGIQVVGAIDARNEYNMSGVDSGCIAGGSANKLVRNGVQITATGLSGANLVSGVMT